ncbi:MAG: PAS domain S-box protein, partial [Anaerolineales bacterium]|nr:PAS domain S-box protein [Anaerolineales bacterium]
IQEEARSYTQRVIKGKTVHRTGVRRRKDFSLVDVEIFGVPVIVDGEQKGVLALYHNISEQKRADEALRKSEEKYRDLVENIDNIIYATDGKGVLTYVSPAVESFLGYQPDEVIGCPFSDFIQTSDIPAITRNFENILSGQISAGEYQIQTKSGHTRWMHTSSRPITVEDKVVGIQGVLSDITERKQAEAALIESEEKFRTLAEQSPNMVFINKGGRIVYANYRCEEVMGYTREEFYAEDFNFLKLIAPGDRDLVLANFKQHISDNELDPYEYTLVTKYGEEIASIITTRLMNYEGETAILGTVTDITERKRAEERLTYIATHDSLTGLPNRSLFYDRLQHAVHNAKRNGLGIAVAFLDLDGFKSVNDTYGHEKGDFLLQDVASRLNSCVRESDSVARLGGDEFTFIFEKVHDPGDAITIAEKIIDSLTKPFKIDGEFVYITASIGISLYPEDGNDTAELIKKADTAMYAAKDLAQNSYRLYSSK